MPAVLTTNTYGKALVRVVKVTRTSSQHLLKELTVKCLLVGDFAKSYTHGDNSMVVPTDTVKNTIYVLAQEHPVNSIEDFGIYVVNHFLKTYSHVHGVDVYIDEHLWKRMPVGSAQVPHKHSFMKAGDEKRKTHVSGTRKGIKIESGIENLVVLKTTGSGFENFHKDKYTTLRETADRILCTSVECNWKFNTTHVEFDRVYERCRQVILDTFANEFSKAVQETIYVMASRMIDNHPELEEVFFRLPNIHVFTFNLAPLGITTSDPIYQPVSDPSGLIEGTVVRQRARL